MFLETNGDIAWLYRCPKFYSPSLQVMDTCYDRKPVLYENKVRFIDPVSRQTFTTAKQQPCYNKQKNLFQLDIENDNSWIELTPGITQVTTIICTQKPETQNGFNEIKKTDKKFLFM